MPEVVRGSRPHDLSPSSTKDSVNLSRLSSNQRNDSTDLSRDVSNSEVDTARPRLSEARGRNSLSWRRERRESIKRVVADVYYDSRAATRREYKRRATTLSEYYKQNPNLLPQLPFTWHRGWRRYRLGLVIFLIFLDACILPIALYYGMAYGGKIEGWIIFAVVTTIWGGPTYLEFALRTLRLLKKERFYRPLGTNSRWCFDLTEWVCVVAITAVTTLFVVGSAPHIVFLRVLSMPGPALLYALGGVLGMVQLFNSFGWKAPFRISSTAKGEPVKPAVYYLIEDVVAVNAVAGRPYREALAARYDASPRFQQMLKTQSLFWIVPSFIIAIPLTVVACLHSVPVSAAYGICWAVPFIWASIWGVISVIWCKRDLKREIEEWEASDGDVISPHKPASDT